MSKKILVLGAGYAGIETALALHKKKKPNDDITISILDKNSYHTLLTELHEVAGNRISEDGVIVPLRDIFKYTNVNIIKDEVNKIDLENRKLVSKSQEYCYDYLIIAGGSQPNFFGIPGMEENCFPLWSFDNAVRIREHIKECFIKASMEKSREKRQAMLTFAVGGGGFSGVEMVGELALWVKTLCKENNIHRDEVKLLLIEALPKILNNLKEKNIEKSMDYLKNKLKVDVITGKAIVKLTPDIIELRDGTIIPSNTLIWTAGVRASCLTDQVDIVKEKASRLRVNEYCQTQFENVYAVGDISGFTSGNSILPALVEGAIQTGKAAALNIIADIRKNEKKKLEPKFHGVMVSIGSFFAVSDIMGYQLPRLLSIFMKYLVNIHYLFGIGGFEQVIKYIKHEFLNKQQDKFILEEHYSTMTPTFWLVPIRLFLGYAWLMEGVKKVSEGWLSKAMLAGTQVDGNTSASVTEAGEKLFRIVSAHTPFWYAWIADTFVVPNALLFQTLIVLSEIGIGLALLSGTFTFIAGLAALGLNINFILSTGLYDYNWWFIPAAMCMLGGAGRSFGVDHYLIPYLMRQWRYFVRNTRIKLWLFD